MRIRCSFILLLALCLSMGFADESKKQVKPQLQTLLLTEGIVGGIVPPEVRLKALVVPKKDKYDVVAMRLNDKHKKEYFKGQIDKKEVQALLKELNKQKFWTLPIEVPTGCADIYGHDTSLYIKTVKKSWMNGGPAGCIHGVSKVNPNEKQMKTFARVLTLIKKKLAKKTIVKSDEETFKKALKLVVFPKKRK